MPDALKVVLALLPAVGLFFVIRTVVGRRIAQAVALAKAEATAARAGVEERLRGREEQIAELRGALAAKERRESELEAESSGLKAQVAGYDEKVKAFETAESRLTDAFQNLASHALTRNNQQFLALAKENLERLQSEAKGDLEQRQQAIAAVVEPIQLALGKIDAEVRRVESSRLEAYGALSEQVKSLLGSQEKLQLETGNLVKALRRPEARGRWGEMQLRRVVEFAGMLNHVDFVEQESSNTDEGRRRPDLIVRLPGGRSVVVDAKTPLDAYLSAIEARTEEERAIHLIAHARQLKEQVRKLAQTAYTSQFADTPEFVVLFLPSDAFFTAALEQEPGLIEDAFQQSVLIATPATLVALLKTVYYGWRQESLTENAQKIAAEARELYNRVRIFSEHIDKVGKGLEDAVKAHNKASSAFASRVLPQGRRVEELGAATEKKLAAPRAVALGTQELASLPSGPASEDGGEAEGDSENDREGADLADNA
ncbi:MAG: DNA recombination protein RmuC [Thermoanaerobaculia bacterium]|nr:DNA recombination protein RmuC [Thermoanaerobaculia bacterium]